MAKKKKRQIRHADIVQLFAERLRELRHSRGLTQAELARTAKVATSYVGRLESADAAPGIDLVGRLAGALGTTVHELLPVAELPDTDEVLRERAEVLFTSRHRFPESFCTNG